MSSSAPTTVDSLRDLIANQVRESNFNHLAHLDGSPVSDAPLVGFADAYDPLIGVFKRVVGPSHLSPLEAWQKAFPSASPPDDLSIIAWVLPFSEVISKSNRGPLLPSRHWAHGRLYIEAVNNQVRDRLVDELAEQGHRAVAPARTDFFDVDWESPAGPVSTWSERHYCYVAGLGTFGLNRGLITARGMSMRCGSIVADVALPPTEREGSLAAHCPFLENGGCGVCIDRCPVGAITPDGKDNVKCYKYLFETIGPQLDDLVSQEAINATKSATQGRLGICGLCHTGVPCEERIPPPSMFKRRTAQSNI